MVAQALLYFDFALNYRPDRLCNFFNARICRRNLLSNGWNGYGANCPKPNPFYIGLVFSSYWNIAHISTKTASRQVGEPNQF